MELCLAKYYMCVWSVVPPTRRQISRKIYWISEKEFIPNVKLIESNSET